MERVILCFVLGKDIFDTRFIVLQPVAVMHAIKEAIVISTTPIIRTANARRQPKAFIVKSPSRVTLSHAKMRENAVVPTDGQDISVKLPQINFLCRVLMERAT
jgi:hypothetical protein